MFAGARLRGVGAATLAATGWGLGLVMTKSVVGVLPPFLLLTVQMTASVGFLWGAVLTGRHVVPASAWRRAPIGLLEPALAYAFAVPGLALTTASSASLIGATEPAMIALLAWAILREKPSLRIILALCIAFAGVMLISAPAFGDDSGRGILRGDALVFAGAATAALYVVLSSRTVLSVDPLVLVAVQQAVALAAVAGLTGILIWTGIERVDLDRIKASAWIVAILSGIVQYALTFWLYMIALRHLKAGAAGFFLTLIPVAGVAGSVFLLGETFPQTEWSGCAAVLLASILIASGHTERADPATTLTAPASAP
jgi:drug/metabolite transporter (DMT)-like permease